jgi:hypothetical protein
MDGNYVVEETADMMVEGDNWKVWISDIQQCITQHSLIGLDIIYTNFENHYALISRFILIREKKLYLYLSSYFKQQFTQGSPVLYKN